MLTMIPCILSGCDLQRSMLYYPGAAMPAPEVLAANNMTYWPSGPDNYRGFISAPRGRPVRGTVIVFHGNAGTADERVFYAGALIPLGYRVILSEYPGYGSRPGELGERSFVADAKETARLAAETYGGPVILLGESLGCGIAAAVAGDASAKISRLVLITPWDSLLAVARSKFRFLPVRLFMKDSYDNISNLKGFKGRVAVVGAEKDEILPVTHAQQLHNSLPADKKIWLIKGAGHNDWPYFVNALFWKEIIAFVSDGDD
ncbi:MAG: alpha/beta hydrolase [Thermodesulfovibrionales bacterium]